MSNVENEKTEAIPAKPKKCQWCGGRCGSKKMRYVKYGDSPCFKGWFSPVCEELSSFAHDDSERND